jgi:hypothetical protein
MSYKECVMCKFDLNNLSKEEYSWLSNIFDPEDFYYNSDVKEALKLNDSSILNSKGYSDNFVNYFNNIVLRYCTPECSTFPMFYMLTNRKDNLSDVSILNDFDYFPNIEAYFSDYTQNVETDILPMAKVIQDFLRTFRPTQKISFRWVRYDNAGHDTYDGGVYNISAEEIKHVSLKELMNSF